MCTNKGVHTMGTKKQRFVVYLEKDLVEQIKKMASDLSLSMSSVVSMLLTYGFAFSEMTTDKMAELATQLVEDMTK